MWPSDGSMGIDWCLKLMRLFEKYRHVMNELRSEVIIGSHPTFRAHDWLRTLFPVDIAKVASGKVRNGALLPFLQ